MRVALTWFLAVLLLAPAAGAASVPVTAALTPDLQRWTEEASEPQTFTTFAFAASVYNTTGYDNDSIRLGQVRVVYDADRSLDQNRVYRTTLTLNNTDQVQARTVVTFQERFFGQSVKVTVCHNVKYVDSTGVIYSAEVDCTGRTLSRFVARGAAFIEHDFNVGRVYDDGNVTGFSIRFSHATFGTVRHYVNDVQLGVPTVNQTRFIHAATLRAESEGKPAERITTTYSWITFNDFAATLAAFNNALACERGQSVTDKLKDLFSIPCLEEAMKLPFDVTQKFLIKVFGFFPGGKEFATMVAEGVELLIGVPVFTVALVLKSPGNFFFFTTLYLLQVGSLTYATGTDSVAVVFRPLVTFYKGLGIVLIGGTRFLYELVASLVATVVSAVRG